MFVRPVEGRAARDPVTRAMLPAEGDEKPLTAFWARRLRDKDVEEFAPIAPKAEADQDAKQMPSLGADAGETHTAEAVPAEER